ncbi:hypothetical protein ACIOK4_42810 [Streptomyces bottropensis]|uniref:hypothetical protein n=1 Tax=Streptomyces bottropensis TaxID=42235 RepID=UPI0037B63804
MGALYWKISESASIAMAPARSDALEELRRALQAEYAVLRRCVRVVDLEGPDEVGAAAEAFKASTDVSFRAFKELIDGDRSASRRFDAAYEPFWSALTRFVDIAKSAVRTP